jgi:hypothetical protein
MAKIPEFKTLDEAAAFWDTHDFEDYIDDTEPVTFEVKITRRKGPAVIRLTGKLVDDRLVLSPPTDQSVPIRVHENEIALEDGRRIVVDFVPTRRVPA